MDFRSTVFVTIIMLGAITTGLRADMLWLRDSEVPIPGMVVSETADSVEFRYRVDGAEQTKEFERDRIQELVITIDQQALERLNPNDLRMYLDQAEQLAANRPDVYAIQTAKRLCLIVARWGQSEMRESAFRLLVTLCEGEELTRVRRLAYVYQPTLDFWESPEISEKGTSVRAREAVVEIVRLICREQSSEAKRRMEDELVAESVRQTLNRFSSVCNFEELMAAMDADSISLSQLGRLLRLERALETNQPSSNLRRPGLGKNWYSASEQIDASRSVLPEFKNVLPFDPSLTVYREGKWVEPDKRQ